MSIKFAKIKRNPPTKHITSSDHIRVLGGNREARRSKQVRITSYMK